MFASRCANLTFATAPSAKRRRLDSASRAWVPIRRISCQQKGDGDDDQPPAIPNKLATIVRRKQEEMAAQLKELGEEAMEERLQSATQNPARPNNRLARLIAEVVPTGRPVLVFELARGGSGSTAASSEQLGGLAAQLVTAGADAFAVKTDSEDTPQPLMDLMAVIQAASRASGGRLTPAAVQMAAASGVRGLGAPPVLQRDWFIHPLQVAAAKEAGAAGIIGTIASVTSRGTPVMSSFAAAIGLDCPVEIVNMQELNAMEQSGVPFYASNLSVGLSISVAGFGMQVATGLLGELPFGAISMVGARSMEEARQARLAGADSILVKWELVQQHCSSPRQLAQLVEAVWDATNGDD